MAIVLENEIRTNVTVKPEVYASTITIHGNPHHDLDSVVLLALQRLEYHDDVLTHTTPLPSLTETAAQVVGRSKTLSDGTVVTGAHVMEWIKLYVEDKYDEHVAAQAPPEPEPDPDPAPEP